MQPERPAIDLLKEFRLRTWARLNYVPSDERCDIWHPVVLEEMQMRDAEIARDRFVDEVLAAILAAAEDAAAEGAAVEAGPVAMASAIACATEPVVAAARTAFVAVDREVTSRVTRVLATFVPLAPGPYPQRVDEAHAGPPAPHLSQTTTRSRERVGRLESVD